MIIETFVMLFGIGLGTFVVGSFLGRPDIGFIGAVLILGVGAIGLVDGLSVQTGEFINETATNETVVEYTYEDIGTISSFPLEFVVLILGAVMSFKSLDDMGEL